MPTSVADNFKFRFMSTRPNREEIERSMETFAREPNGGLIPIPGPAISVNRGFIISLANHYRLPNVHGFRYFPAHGGLASYGFSSIAKPQDTLIVS